MLKCFCPKEPQGILRKGILWFMAAHDLVKPTTIDHPKNWQVRAVAGDAPIAAVALVETRRQAGWIYGCIAPDRLVGHEKVGWIAYQP